MDVRRLLVGFTFAAAAAAALCAGVTVRSQPADGAGGGGSAGGAGGSAPLEGRPPRRWEVGRINEEEMQQALQFLAEVSPNRAAVIERAVSNTGMNPLRRQLYTKWRELKLLEEEDPTLYAIKLEQIRKEDVMFGEAAFIRAARGHGSDEHYQKLRKAAREFVQLRIKEREHLIAKLQAGLDFDRNHTEQAADARAQRELMRERGGPSGGGGGGTGGRGVRPDQSGAAGGTEPASPAPARP